MTPPPPHGAGRYRDGKLYASKSGGSCSIPQVKRKYFFFGGEPCNHTGGDTKVPWNAELSWVGIFKGALSASEALGCAGKSQTHC